MIFVPPIPVCGIGASAGGIEALQQLFAALPTDLGLAYVIVVHLAPDRKSELPSIIGRFTTMKVIQVGDHEKVNLAPDTIFVIAPDRKLEITGTSVGASSFERPRGQRNAVDLFFRSLAAAHGDGFAVVLSGSGSDGALGAKAVKESGGLVLVQDPLEATHGDMPRAVIATGVADLVLPIQELARQIAELARDKHHVSPLLRAADHSRQIPEDEDKALRGVLELLRRRTGHDFSKYKRATVLRRLSRRMQLAHHPLIADYLRYLRTEPGEVQALLGDLLISVTTFFRDPDAWDELRARVIAPLVERADGVEQIRAWVAGCATGEEAYTLAILLHEEFESRKLRPNFIIFASDVDESAVAHAREGVYPRAINTDVSEARLERYFRIDGERYCVENEIRDHVVFAVHSVLRDPPFSRQHLISCRNLLIYLDRELQEQVMGVFRYALRDNGYLFLGASELANGELFKPIDAKHRIFVGIDRTNDRPALPEILTSASPTIRSTREPRQNNRLAIGDVHIAALEAASAPSVLVDDRNNVLHLSTTAAKFLQQSGGVPARRLTDLVRPELRDELHALLHRALEEPEPHLSPFVAVALNGSSHRVAMLAQRHTPVDDGRTYILVTFLDAGESREHPPVNDQQPTDDLVRELREELRQAEQRIETMRDDHLLTNEDLRAANEELQSLNEEYRSTTEELETSKEELQSINEELQTLNHEIKSKLEEVSRTHADLENFVAAADVAILFLDRDLRIKRYTPRLADIFSIRSRDIDRPIGELVNTLNYARLEDDAKGVLGQVDGPSIEREVHSGSGKTYIMRVSPYRSPTQREADGVVVTFVDVSAIKRAEVALRQSEERYRSLFDSIDEGYCTIEVMFDGRGTPLDYRFLEANPAFARVTGLKSAIGKTVRELLPDHEDFWFQTYGHVATSGEAMRFEHPAASLARFFDVYAFRISAPELRQVAVLLNDITERKRRESNVAFLAEITQELVRLTHLDATMTAICRRIVEHFGVFRCVVSELDEAEEAPLVAYQWRRDGTPATTDSPPIAGLNASELREAYRRGETVIVEDAARDARVDAGLALAADAFVAVPIVRDGKWRFTVTVFAQGVRPWRQDEVVLLEELTTRVYTRLENARAEHLLRESESRTAFLVDLADRLRPLSEPAEIMETTSAALGRHLGVDRSGYGEVDESGEFITFSRDYRTSDIISLSGRRRLEDFGKSVIDVQRAGQTLVIDDARVDARLSDPAVAQTFVDAQIVAGIAVPLIKRDRYVAVLFVHQSTQPRAWTPAEVSLVEEVAERTWDAVERARAEGALREAHAELEQRVLKRTEDLASAITSLQAENLERRSAEAQNKALFQRLLKVQEEERRRLARDLHDQLGQQMTALRMNLEVLVGGTRDDARLAAQTERVQQLAAELDQSVDFLTWDLRPAALSDFGLTAALEELVTGWTERFGIPASFDADGTEAIRLPADVEANAYRLAQEALHNVVKHAEATRVTASLRRLDDDLELKIEDNGRGFVMPSAATAGDGGLGLMSMKERAEIIGGTLTIASAPGRGTSVVVRIPITNIDPGE